MGSKRIACFHEWVQDLHACLAERVHILSWFSWALMLKHSKLNTNRPLHNTDAATYRKLLLSCLFSDSSLLHPDIHATGRIPRFLLLKRAMHACISHMHCSQVAWFIYWALRCAHEDDAMLHCRWTINEKRRRPCLWSTFYLICLSLARWLSTSIRSAFTSMAGGRTSLMPTQRWFLNITNADWCSCGHFSDNKCLTLTLLVHHGGLQPRSQKEHRHHLNQCLTCDWPAPRWQLMAAQQSNLKHPPEHSPGSTFKVIHQGSPIWSSAFSILSSHSNPNETHYWQIALFPDEEC